MQIYSKMTNTDLIFKTTTPYNNPYQNQSKYPRLLFVCSAGLLRSATGAALYAKYGYNTRAAGTHEFALVPLSANLIKWADKIVFVNDENYRHALQTFDGETELLELIGDKSKVLAIPDNFSFMEKGLVDAYEQQLGWGKHDDTTS